MEHIIKVVIAEDIDVIRGYFKTVLDHETNIQVVDAVSSGKEAVESVRKHRPDILLTDIQMESHSDGLDAIAEITRQFPAVNCIVLTVHEEDEMIFKAFEVGAVDYIIKDASAVEIIGAIRMAYEGEVSIRPGIADKLRREYMRIKNDQSNFIRVVSIFCHLTQTEFEVLDLLSQDMSVSEISRQRCVEVSTVRTHINNILKKFDMHSTKEVIGLIKRLGMKDLLNKYFCVGEDVKR